MAYPQAAASQARQPVEMASAATARKADASCIGAQEAVADGSGVCAAQFTPAPLVAVCLADVVAKASHSNAHGAGDRRGEKQEDAAGGGTAGGGRSEEDPSLQFWRAPLRYPGDVKPQPLDRHALLDYFVSHVWHVTEGYEDAPADTPVSQKAAALQSFGVFAAACFEKEPSRWPRCVQTKKEQDQLPAAAAEDRRRSRAVRRSSRQRTEDPKDAWKHYKVWVDKACAAGEAVSRQHISSADLLETTKLALRSSRGFLAVLHPRYFSRLWCVCEWALYAAHVAPNYRAMHVIPLETVLHEQGVWHMLVDSIAKICLTSLRSTSEADRLELQRELERLAVSLPAMDMFIKATAFAHLARHLLTMCDRRCYAFAVNDPQQEAKWRYVLDSCKLGGFRDLALALASAKPMLWWSQSLRNATCHTQGDRRASAGPWSAERRRSPHSAAAESPDSCFETSKEEVLARLDALFNVKSKEEPKLVPDRRNAKEESKLAASIAMAWGSQELGVADEIKLQLQHHLKNLEGDGDPKAALAAAASQDEHAASSTAEGTETSKTGAEEPAAGSAKAREVQTQGTAADASQAPVAAAAATGPPSSIPKQRPGVGLRKTILTQSVMTVPEGLPIFVRALAGAEPLSEDEFTKARLFRAAWAEYNAKVDNWFDRRVVPVLERWRQVAVRSQGGAFEETFRSVLLPTLGPLQETLRDGLAASGGCASTDNIGQSGQGSPSKGARMATTTRLSHSLWETPTMDRLLVVGCGKEKEHRWAAETAPPPPPGQVNEASRTPSIALSPFPLQVLEHPTTTLLCIRAEEDEKWRCALVPQHLGAEAIVNSLKHLLGQAPTAAPRVTQFEVVFPRLCLGLQTPVDMHITLGMRAAGLLVPSEREELLPQAGRNEEPGHASPEGSDGRHTCLQSPSPEASSRRSPNECNGRVSKSTDLGSGLDDSYSLSHSGRRPRPPPTPSERDIFEDLDWHRWCINEVVEGSMKKNQDKQSQPSLELLPTVSSAACSLTKSLPDAGALTLALPPLSARGGNRDCDLSSPRSRCAGKSMLGVSPLSARERSKATTTMEWQTFSRSLPMPPGKHFAYKRHVYRQEDVDRAAAAGRTWAMSPHHFETASPGELRIKGLPSSALLRPQRLPPMPVLRTLAEQRADALLQQSTWKQKPSQALPPPPSEEPASLHSVAEQLAAPSTLATVSRPHRSLAEPSLVSSSHKSLPALPMENLYWQWNVALEGGTQSCGVTRQTFGLGRLEEATWKGDYTELPSQLEAWFHKANAGHWRPVDRAAAAHGWTLSRPASLACLNPKAVADRRCRTNSRRPMRNHLDMRSTMTWPGSEDSFLEAATTLSLAEGDAAALPATEAPASTSTPPAAPTPRRSLAQSAAVASSPRVSASEECRRCGRLGSRAQVCLQKSMLREVWGTGACVVCLSCGNTDFQKNGYLQDSESGGALEAKGGEQQQPQGARDTHLPRLGAPGAGADVVFEVTATATLAPGLRPAFVQQLLCRVLRVPAGQVFVAAMPDRAIGHATSPGPAAATAGVGRVAHISFTTRSAGLAAAVVVAKRYKAEDIALSKGPGRELAGTSAASPAQLAGIYSSDRDWIYNCISDTGLDILYGKPRNQTLSQAIADIDDQRLLPRREDMCSLVLWLELRYIMSSEFELTKWLNACAKVHGRDHLALPTALVIRGNINKLRRSLLWKTHLPESLSKAAAGMKPGGGIGVGTGVERRVGVGRRQLHSRREQRKFGGHGDGALHIGPQAAKHEEALSLHRVLVAREGDVDGIVATALRSAGVAEASCSVQALVNEGACVIWALHSGISDFDKDALMRTPGAELFTACQIALAASALQDWQTRQSASRLQRQPLTDQFFCIFLLFYVLMTVAKIADDLKPGEYVLIRDATLTLGADVSSDDLQELAAGETVQVLEVLHLEADRRIRGRLREPSGWISLVGFSAEDDTVCRWAILPEQEDAEVRIALRKNMPLTAAALLRSLQRSRRTLMATHKDATTAWRTPLSLFGARAEAEARDRLVPEWAITCVQDTKRLIDEAMELHDLCDVYETQIRAASSSDARLHRVALRTQFERLDDLLPRLRESVAVVHAARCAFDLPAEAPGEMPIGLLAVAAGGRRGAKSEARVGILNHAPSLDDRLRCLYRDLSRSLSSNSASPTAASSEVLTTKELARENEGLPLPTKPAPDVVAAPVAAVAESDAILAPPLEEAPASRLLKVRVRAGSLVDLILFDYSDGSVQPCPWGHGGVEHPPFVLEKNEVLVEVRGRAGWFLDAIQFVTSSGRFSPMYGSGSGGKAFELRVAPGKQLWALERTVLGTIASLVEQPMPKVTPCTPPQRLTAATEFRQSRYSVEGETL
eukprot:TRINITY_DN12628_c0_g1_i2.p1 TRINITY_DN12628_c0_g1~~TRINITY_DN12628_c0_g1_i2.p1  ORF type:complete len:2359 (-),score=516.31 TRINITY_DN12628_c0_g1_i2:144-7220(-)